MGETNERETEFIAFMKTRIVAAIEKPRASDDPSSLCGVADGYAPTSQLRRGRQAMLDSG